MSLGLGYYWPSIQNELQLQYQCHLNESDQAYENGRLNKRVDDCRKREDELNDRLRQCENDVNHEHSTASRSFWLGFFFGMGALIVFVIFIAILVTICCHGVFRRQPHLAVVPRPLYLQ